MVKNFLKRTLCILPDLPLDWKVERILRLVSLA